MNPKIQKLQNWKKMADEYKNDIKRLKKNYNSSTRINLEKDVRISDLERQKSNPEKVCSVSIFANSEHLFEPEDMKSLRSISTVSQRDSTFILTLIRILYKNNLNLTPQRSASKKQF